MATASKLTNENLRVFNRPDRVVEGWYWACRSDEVPRAGTKAVRMIGKDLVIWRNERGEVFAHDAHCPHRGAHLARATVTGGRLQCAYHRWEIDSAGQVAKIPCQEALPDAQIGAWPAAERYGMVWVWTGAVAKHPVPEIPGLEGVETDVAFGPAYDQNCHPNVVMCDAIDTQHFASVHRIDYLLDLQIVGQEGHEMRFANTRTAPKDHPVGRVLSWFYGGPVTYSLAYWYGAWGSVTLGPDFAHFYTIFANRPTEDGRTEGQVILVTKRGAGLRGRLKSRVKLGLTKRVVGYFGIGDTPNFSSIRFDFKTPIKADAPLIAFIKHVEGQPTAEFGFSRAG